MKVLGAVEEIAIVREVSYSIIAIVAICKEFVWPGAHVPILEPIRHGARQ